MKTELDAVFFDFDGVILDSVDVKTNAFAEMFRKYGPEIETAVVEYHLANGGVSRFRKFEYYYRHLLNKDINQEILNALGEEFNRLSLNGVLEASYIEGALETLKKLMQLKIPAFVASGTPHEELQNVLKKKDLSKYFVEAHGSPRKKQEIIIDVAYRYKLLLKNCLFIGDALTDFEAAKDCKMPFLGIVKEKEMSPFPSHTKISSFVGLF